MSYSPTALVAVVLVVLIETVAVARFWGVDSGTEFMAVFCANIASAVVGRYSLPLPQNLADGIAVLVRFGAAEPGAAVVVAQFIAIAAAISTLVEFPIIQAICRGRWIPKSLRSALADLLAVLAMGVSSTAMIVIVAVVVLDMICRDDRRSA